MKRYSLWIKLAMLFCVTVTVVFAPPSSLAYIAANSNTVHNSFRVEYLPPQDICVPVMIKKSIVNLSDEEIGAGGFDFCLANVDTGEAIVAESAADGRAAIYLTFTADDVGKTYRYRLNELNTGCENMIYDDKVYNLSIQITLNEIHELSAELRMDGSLTAEIAAEFVNKYYVPAALPDTGDPAQPMVWLAMLLISGSALAMMMKKRIDFRRMQ